ncbi:MAG: hypothetical protein HON70_19960, partial [Lentisphaerae bacterium]|nr:hypothetical protein [Lentisphaerota bacterium]
EAGQSALFDDSEALVADLLKAVTSPVWRGGRVAGDVFAAEGVAYRAFDGRATADTFRQWLVELPSYEKLVPDPRGSRSEMTRRLDACAQDIVQIREVDAEVQAIPAGELAALDERAAQLGAVVEDTWGPPGVVKYADTIKERHTRVVKRFDALEGQLKVLWEKVESPTDWVARVKGQLFPGTSPSLSAAWLERREALLVGVHAGRLQADPSQYAALRAKVRRTYRLLEQLDGAEALSSGLPEVGEDLADARRDRAVAAALQRRRDDTLKGVLNDLDWRKGAPLPLFAEYAADTKWHARCEGFAEERRVLLRCRGDVAVATKRLESVYSPGEKGKDGRTVLELMAPWKDHPLRGDVDVGSMLIPLLERVSRLHDVSTSADRAHLAALMTAGATDLGTRLVAWNRLGRITSRPWPATVAELDTAARVSTELSQRIRSTVPEPDRQKELAARITKQLRSGWFACLPLMRDQEALSKALREHSTFGVLADDVAEGLLDGERKHGWLVLCAGAAPDVMPGLVRRCWELLAKSGPPEWPAGIPDLVSETRISARLAELQPQQRRQVLAESLTRWQRCFNRLRSPSMLDQAFAVLEVIAVDVGGLAATGPALGPLQVPNVMSPHARFNLILGQLRRRCVRGTIPDLDDARALRLRDGVVQAIQRLGAGLADETVLGTFVPQLQGIVADPQAASRTLDLEDAGPGAVGWQVVAVGDDRRAVTYAQTFGERRQELAFLRVEPDVGEPAFLCIEELSLGLFSDVLSSRTDWKADGFIADTVAEDLRQGPRVWELVGGGDRPRFVPAKTWLTPVPIDRPYYPESVSAGRPAWEHPVQYVSADFARPFSRMLGCRPPTVKEWQAARRTTGDGDVNRRDVTWSRQKQHIDRLSAEGFIVVEYPDAGMFVDAEATGPDATTTVGSDDGVLWFRKAAHSSSAVFVGLLGNVAEYVLVAAGRPPSAAPEELTEIAVIGGSALWPPGVSEEAPQTNLDPDLGFADVGLRLAFTAPPESCAGQLARIVRRQSYSFPVQR